MRQPGGRSIAFVSGLMIGMLSALGIVFLLMNDLDPIKFSYRNPFGSQADTIVDRTSKTPVITSINKSKPKALPPSADSLEPEPIASDSLLIQERILLPDENMIIRRDELIETKTIDASRIQTKESSRQKNDSLIRQFSENPPQEEQRYKVEYWKSPVNFKGYRLIRNSLVLFGLSPEVPLTLQQTNDYLLLRYGKQTYKLQPTESFEPLPKVMVD
jgi:hypothetical protein